MRCVIHCRPFLPNEPHVRLEARTDGEYILLESWFGIGGLLTTIRLRREDLRQLAAWADETKDSEA